jgi:hypothetical protein
MRTAERDLHALKRAFDLLAAATSKPLVPVKQRELKSGLREATAVALLSDVHADEPVRKGETPYPNEYSLEIADQGVGRFFAAYEWLIELHRERFKIRDLALWIGGDLGSGLIHEELKERVVLTPIEMVLWWLPRLISGIDRLLMNTKPERLLVICSRGNHGRDTAKIYRGLGAEHSYEWLLYQILADHYAARGEKRVSFLADRSAHQYATIYNFDTHWHHGDEIQYQGGVGGIMIPVNKAVGQWDSARRCHYHNFGHWHQYMQVDNVTVNGSMIGYNAYAMSVKAKPEPARQAFYLIDSKRGKTCKSPIWVRE